MKRATIFLMFLAALFGCGGDDDDDSQNVTKEYVVVDEVLILSDTKENVIKVKANCKWNAFVDVDWITLEPSSGEEKGTVTVIAKPNKTGAERKANVTFRNEKLTEEEVTIVTQPKAEDESFIPAADDNPLPE